MPTDPDALQLESPTRESFLQRHGDTILLVGLVAYVVLLLIGTIGTLLEIEVITSFWLYR